MIILASIICGNNVISVNFFTKKVKKECQKCFQNIINLSTFKEINLILSILNYTLSLHNF